MAELSTTQPSPKPIGLDQVTASPGEARLPTCSAEATVAEKCGFGARKSSLFLDRAMEFSSSIEVTNLSSVDSSIRDGKSVFGALMLAAAPGNRLRVTASGTDCKEAVAALIEIIERDDKI